jgi:hypothetical protein
MKAFLLTIACVFLSSLAFGQDKIELLRSELIHLKKLKDSLRTELSIIEQKVLTLEEEIPRLILYESVGKNFICIMGTGIYGKPGGYKSYGSIVTGNLIYVVGDTLDYYKVVFKDGFGYVLKDALADAQPYFEKKSKDSLNRMEKEKRMEELRAENDRIAKEQDSIRIVRQKEQELIRQQRQKSDREATAKKQKEQQEAIERSEADRMKSLYDKYKDSEYRFDIILKKARLGMTKAMVLDSWGKPISINKSVGSWGVNEQWVYSSAYFYFENGLLTSYQTQR